MILSEEHEQVIKEHAVIHGMDYEEFKRLVVNVLSVFENIANKLMDLVKTLAKTFIEIVDVRIDFNDKPMWFTQRVIVLKSQVLNRKPMMIRARCNC